MSILSQAVLKDLRTGLNLYRIYVHTRQKISLHDHEQVACCCIQHQAEYECKCIGPAFRKLLLAWRIVSQGKKIRLTAKNVRTALKGSIDASWEIAAYFEPDFASKVLLEALIQFESLVRFEGIENKKKLEDTEWTSLRPSLSFKSQVLAKKNGNFCLYFGVTPHRVQVRWNPAPLTVTELPSDNLSVLHKLEAYSKKMQQDGKDACSEFVLRDLVFHGEELVSKTQEIQQWTHFPFCETLWATFMHPDDCASLVVCAIDNFSRAEPELCNQLKTKFSKDAAASGLGYRMVEGEATICLKYKERVQNRREVLLEWMTDLKRELKTRLDPLSSNPLGFLEERVLSVLTKQFINSTFLQECCANFVAENEKMFMGLAKYSLNTHISQILRCWRRSSIPGTVDIKCLQIKECTTKFNGLLLQRARTERIKTLFWGFLVIHLVVGSSLETVRSEITNVLKRFDLQLLDGIQEAMDKRQSLEDLKEECFNLEQQIEQLNLWKYNFCQPTENVIAKVVDAWKLLSIKPIPEFDDALFPNSRLSFFVCWKTYLQSYPKRLNKFSSGKISQLFVEHLVEKTSQFKNTNNFFFFTQTFLITSFLKGFLRCHESLD